MLPAKDWHVGKLKLSEEWSSLWIRGCAMHTNGINTFMGKSLQPSPPPIYLFLEQEHMHKPIPQRAYP